METLWQDIRYGFRILARSPGFAAVVVVILAVGIGANTAIFTMTHAVLMSPLPFDDPERVVYVTNQWKKSGREFVCSGPEYLDWVEQSTVFDELSAFCFGGFNLTGAGDPVALTGLKVTPGFFHTLGLQPALGREFLKEEMETGRHQVTVLGHRLWKDLFGGDPHLVGRQIILDGEPSTVVGVAGPTMGFIEDMAQLYRPLARETLQTGRKHRYLQVLGRLKPAVSVKQAQAQMDLVAARLAEQNPEIDENQGIRIHALRDVVLIGARVAFLVLHGSVGLVLLIACANVSNLLLARSRARAREMAVRSALGAGRGRILRQMLTESVLLGLLGGGLGLILASWGLNILKLIAPKLAETGGSLPGFDEIRLDSAVLAFTATLAVLTAVIFGAVPALRTSRYGFCETLAEGGHRASAGRSQQRTLSALVVSQIALALVLLTGSGLLIRSFIRLQEVSPGFVPTGLLAAQIIRPDTAANRENSRRAAFCEQVVERLADLPGVESAGAINVPPIAASTYQTVFGIKDQASGTEQYVSAEYRMVTNDYFACMKIPLLRGRCFMPSDRTADERVLIANQEFVRRFLPGEEPIGKSLTHDGAVNKIVGVVGNVKLFTLDEQEVKPVVYEPIHQNCSHEITVLIRTTREPEQLAGAVREVVWEVDPDQPILRIQTMNEILGDSTSVERFCMTLLLAMGSVALLMALTGAYAVAASAVNERTREIGIRMAFGAERMDILRLVIKRGAVLVALGLTFGVAGAFVLTRCMRGLLFEISPTDPATFVCVSLLLAGVVLLACYLPARRAARIDPMAALRYE